ncbi:hypothetical protein BC830DRAFT_1157543 [Chytriomyces sp. MP71]|nr:hypothetical protein BC830DRAFT_1157543 [Chytriomyces sp. MP71]
MLSSFVKLETAVPLILAPPRGTGHLGGLSLDALLANLASPTQVETAGCLQSQFVSSLVCLDAFAQTPSGTNLASAIDAFRLIEITSNNTKPVKAVVLQMRSEIIKGHTQKFTDELIHWIKSHNFSSVILLTSFDAFKRTDAQIQSGDLLRFFAPHPISASLHQRCTQLGWTPLEPFERVEEMKSSSSSSPKFPLESGLTERIYDALVDPSSSISPPIPTLVLSWFTPAEGFHFQQALGMAQAVNQFLELKSNGTLVLVLNFIIEVSYHLIRFVICSNHHRYIS